MTERRAMKLFLVATGAVILAQVALGLDWFYAGYFAGVIVGALFFQKTRRP